ncbi:MAG: hypothetical protein ACE5WD_14295, partial [Candidatus Aminicenantia bacterium]
MPKPKQVLVDLIWPKPPDVPRVKLINSFSSPKELGIKAPWYRKFHRVITGKKEEKIKIISPYNIFVDEKGKIYVTDTFTRSIHIFDRKSKKYWEIFSIKGGSFYSPIGVAVDYRERIFVSDSILKKVFVFNKNGKLMFSIGSENF